MTGVPPIFEFHYRPLVEFLFPLSVIVLCFFVALFLGELLGDMTVHRNPVLWQDVYKIEDEDKNTVRAGRGLFINNS